MTNQDKIKHAKKLNDLAQSFKKTNDNDIYEYIRNARIEQLYGNVIFIRIDTSIYKQYLNDPNIINAVTKRIKREYPNAIMTDWEERYSSSTGKMFVYACFYI